MKDVNDKLKNLEETTRQKDEKMSRLKCHLSDMVSNKIFLIKVVVSTSI